MAYKRSRQAFEADLEKQESPYVFYGTALPPLDERVRDDGSFVPVWKQEVTDDRGRKRLHGAFTGGYSAGYFNTVGSKEGWTPSNFVSSRQKVGKGQQPRQQRVEDFMDEEDLREADEARSLQTSETFAGFGINNDSQHRDVLADVFRPSGESVGKKLLRCMGWREGQGIGPRIKREADLGEGQFSKGLLHTFAPPDVPALGLTQKKDRKGLDFEDVDVSVKSKFGLITRTEQPTQAEDGDGEDGESRSAVPFFRPRTATKPRKSGFGVGVLNDTGSDDEDPYSMGPKISYNKTIGGDKPRRVKKPSANPSLQSKPVLLSKKLSSFQGALRKCHDGRLPPEGFVLGDELEAMASLTLKTDKYRPPVVPDDWVSAKLPVESGHEESSYVSGADAAKSSTHTSKSRAAALGEAPLPGKSVFNFLTPAARDRLAAATGNTALPPALGEIPLGYASAKNSRPDPRDLVPPLDKDTALQALTRSSDALGGWSPYAEDLEKRERYKTFLEIRAGLRSTTQGDELPPRAEGMSQTDWVQEMNEFSRAAEVFKPISGLMASRFTSSSSAARPEDEPENTEANSLITHGRHRQEDPAEAAAKMGMFGQMTRSVSNFYPTRLLCKRFGVAMPDINTRPARQETAAAAQRPGPQDILSANVSKFQSAGYQRNEKAEPHPQPQPTDLATSQGDQTTPGTEKEAGRDALHVNPERNEVLEQPRPGMALFKAIFGSDDEDEDE